MNSSSSSFHARTQLRTRHSNDILHGDQKQAYSEFLSSCRYGAYEYSRMPNVGRLVSGTFVPKTIRSHDGNARPGTAEKNYIVSQLFYN